MYPCDLSVIVRSLVANDQAIPEPKFGHDQFFDVIVSTAGTNNPFALRTRDNQIAQISKIGGYECHAFDPGDPAP